jgi:UDP-N-acetylmuramoyl-tripeptide--D-alanyl-D-alanine ligase
MIEIASLIITYLTFMTLAGKRVMTYLHVLQQEDYDTGRLQKWMFENGAFDKRLSIALFVISFAWFYVPPFAMNFLIFFCFAFATYLEKDPRKSLKKKLVATARAKRIFFPTFIIVILMGAWVFIVNSPFNTVPWPWIVIVQLIPFILFLVNGILQPIEESIQKFYWLEAHEKLNEVKPTVIGVTGSFGKTSVKHILGHILSTQSRTLVTPGSVNTAMGISRIIREQMVEGTRYFIVEMGAYGPGSIEALCDLTPPDFGIITAIGHAHYERFRSLETVSRTKFELAQAVIEKNVGKTIIHERTLKFPFARALKFDNKESFVVCGLPPETDPHKQKEVSYMQPGDVHIIGLSQNDKGLEIKIAIKDKKYNLDTPLFGMHHGHNVVLAAVAALELGMDMDKIQVALQSLPQIPHRLEVKRQADDSILIDDSYNSNPMGFRSALDLMAFLGQERRKILITPGMIELGVTHNEIHEKMGAAAGSMCDFVVIIRPGRIPTFKKGAAQGQAKVIEVESFKEASQWLENNRQAGDIILIENDLPDMYEIVPKM